MVIQNVSLFNNKTLLLVKSKTNREDMKIYHLGLNRKNFVRKLGNSIVYLDWERAV